MERGTGNIAMVIVVFLGVFLVYSQTITFDWVHLDDEKYVLNNPLIGIPFGKAVVRIFTEGYFYTYIPVTLLSHALDLRIWGTSPAGHHLTNVLLHCLNAVLVLLLALTVLEGIRGREVAGPRKRILLDAAQEDLLTSLLASLLFAFHPLRAEAVSWIADRKDLLGTALALPLTMMYMRDRFDNRFRFVSLRLVLCLLLLALASLAKNTFVALPGVFLVLEIGMIGRGKTWKERLRGVLYTVPFFLVSLVVGLAAKATATVAVVGYGVEELSKTMFLLLPGYSLLFYPWKIICPFPMVPLYFAPGPPLIVASAIGSLVLVAGLGVAFWKGRWGVPVAFAAYMVLAVPTTAISAWADRYSYAATIPLLLVAAFGISSLVRGTSIALGRRTRLVIGTVTGCLLGIMAFGAVAQSRIWHDELSLWSHQLMYGEKNSIILNNAGIAYLNAGEFGKAKEMFHEAIRVDPHCMEALLNLRTVANSPVEYVELTGLYASALLYAPRDASVHLALGEMLWMRGMEDSAVVEFRQALNVDPECAAAFNDIGLWHMQHGRADSARVCYLAATQRAPGFAPPYSSLGNLAFARCDTAEAVHLWTIAARLGDLTARQRLRALNRFW